MPLTRIDVTDTITADRLSALADALHQAEVETMGIPPDNRHKLIHVHQAGQILIPWRVRQDHPTGKRHIASRSSASAAGYSPRKYSRAPRQKCR